MTSRIATGVRAPDWTVGSILVAGAVLRAVGLGELALLGDESYYWLWSRHLDWAYFDHPAGVALVVRLSTALGGQSEVGVRWLNAVLGVGTVFLTYRLGRQMLARRAGLFAALLLAVGAPYLVTSRFVYTDALQLFLLLLNLSCFCRLVEEKPRPNLKTVCAFGVSLALLFNTKYSAYLYAMALLAALLIDYRWLLIEPKAWIGALIGALGLLPVVAWNAGHHWASFRWQLAHLVVNVGGDQNLARTAYHGLVYLSWPLVALAFAGLGRLRTPRERLLSLVAIFIMLPVALSPADSPRNLSSGLVPLLLLAGTRWPATLRDRRRGALAALLTIGVLVTAIYGWGTVINLAGPSPWPHAGEIHAIRKDIAGWQVLGPILATYPAPIFALDYSVASQAWYYTGRPATTAWGQYRIWGIPDLHDATIVSLDYLPEDLVSAQLRDAFRHVEGPQLFQFTERGATKVVRLWQAEGLGLDQETLLQRLDFLTLLEFSR